MRKEQPTRPMVLLEMAQEWRKELRKEKESPEWTARILASQKNELFYKGLQFLRKSDFSNSYRPIDQQPIHYTLNEFAFWCNVNVAKWLNSRVDYRVHGLEDDIDANNAAQKLLRIGQYYDDRDWTRSEVIRASKQCQFTGHLVAYIYHDPTYAERKAYRPVMERKKVKLGEDAYQCVVCGNVGEIKNPNAPAMCEACGSDQVAVTEVPEVETDYEVGQQEVQCGDVTHRLIPLYNLCWSARRGLADSDVVLWEEEFTREELESTYQGIELPTSRVTDRGLQARASLQNGGQGTKDTQSRYVLSRLWVNPCRYSQYELKEAVKFQLGELAAGTKLIEAFPKGVHIIMVGDTIVDVYPAIKNEDLAGMEYQSSGDGLAHGVDDMCEPQRMMNVGTSLTQAWLRHNATPPLTFVNGVVDPGDLSGDLTRPIPIEATAIGIHDGVTVENAIMYRQGQSLPPAVLTLQDRWRAAIQFAAAATEFSEGLPNVNNDTLGGARIAQGLAQSISSIPLAQFADFRAKIIKLKLKKFKEWCWDERYIQFAGQYGILEGDYLQSADIPDDFQFETVPNSWLPRLPEQKQQNFQALLTALGGPAGLAVAPPSVLAEMCEIYDVRLSENSYPAAIRTARMRIRQAVENLPSIQQAQQVMQQAGMPEPMDVQADPMTGAAMVTPITPGQILFEMLQPPFNPREDGHGMAAEFISRWLTTDDGLQAPLEIIDFVGVLQGAHIESQAMHNVARAGVEMAGQPMPEPGAGGGKGTPSPPAPPKPGNIAQPGG